MKIKFIVVSLLGTIVLFLSLVCGNTNSARPFHTPTELAVFAQHFSAHTPIGPGDWFLSSYSCRGCHGHDTLGLANIDEGGNDVNLVSQWESSMMALAAKDPLWRAKVSQEILTNPAHEGELQDKCTSCHAPTGRYNHNYRGLGFYRLSDVVNDTLGRDGVNCTGCHLIQPTTGFTFSGQTPYDTTRTIYGPFTLPMVGPMQLYEGYTPTYSPHTDQSAMCSSCHTLITQTADLSGNLTGGEFVEQATYHEYLNSSFPSNNIKCQTCHMPQLADPVVIANGFMALQPRYPFNQHVFAGANHFMLSLIKNNKAALDVQVDDERFDSTLDAIAANLRLNAINFALLFDSAASDTGYFRVKLENKVGHKFPSGYPSRRAVVQFVVTDSNSDTLFRSGIFDNDFRVVGETSAFEPHHEMINTSDVSQIYELVMGDVNYNFTSVLERAAHILKDNRLPPLGFTTQHSAYDTVQVSPDALSDSDFNQLAGTQGTATDYIHFHVPVSSVNGQLTVRAKVYYQAVPPKWLDEMFQLSSTQIDTFRNMYTSADRNPFLVAADSLNLTLTGQENLLQPDLAIVYPTLSEGTVGIEAADGNRIVQVRVYATSGKEMMKVNPASKTNPFQLNLPSATGTYFLRIETTRGILTKKIVRL